MVVKVHVEVTDKRIKDDPLVKEWCEAMARKLPKLLEDGGKRVMAEALERHRNGYASGDWHVLKAQHNQMDSNDKQARTETQITSLEKGHDQPAEKEKEIT